MLTRMTSFKDYDGEALKLPNSVAVFEDGNVAVADGGNNRVCVFDPEGQPVWQHDPKAGFKPYNLREPIFVGISPDQKLYASDWHNHRFLIFDQDYKFLRTIFHLGDVSMRTGVSRFLWSVELFLKHLMTQHVGASHYFTSNEMSDGQSKKADYSFQMFFQGLGYYLLRPKLVWDILFDRNEAVRKANGIVFQDNGCIIITQKANQCVSVYSMDGDTVVLEKHIHVFDGIGFGRLCNLSQGKDGHIYVCDQNNQRIVMFDAELNEVKQFDFDVSDEVPMAPFGCVEIGDDMLACARSFGIEIIRISNCQRLWACNDMGETHGIAYDPSRRFLYYVDRSNSEIVQFYVNKVM